MDTSLPWIDAAFTYNVTPQGLPKYIYLSPPLIFPKNLLSEKFHICKLPKTWGKT
jgi:hypothetical protein